MSNFILYEIDDGVAIVTINRPDALNALNPQVLGDLFTVMEELHYDKKVKVVILRGAGDKAFVAGADIAAMSTMSPEEAKEFAVFGHRTMNRIASMRPFTIAAVNGFALGGGCELAMSCDMRVGSTKARMGIPEVSLGVIPGFGGTQRLPRLIGLGMAQELLATGRQCKAQECKEIGLLNRVVEPEELMETCKELARSIAKNSTSAIFAGKQCMSAGIEMGLEEGLELEIAAFASTFTETDQKEGMTAFLEKRKAEFS